LGAGRDLLKLRELSLQLRDPLGDAGLVGVGPQLVQPQLPLPEPAAQLALGGLERLGAGPDALGRGPRLRQQLGAVAATLLALGDPLLDRGAPLANLL